MSFLFALTVPPPVWRGSVVLSGSNLTVQSQRAPYCGVHYLLNILGLCAFEPRVPHRKILLPSACACLGSPWSVKIATADFAWGDRFWKCILGCSRKLLQNPFKRLAALTHCWWKEPCTRGHKDMRHCIPKRFQTSTMNQCRIDSCLPPPEDLLYLPSQGTKARRHRNETSQTTETRTCCIIQRQLYNVQ